MVTIAIIKNKKENIQFKEVNEQKKDTILKEEEVIEEVRKEVVLEKVENVEGNNEKSIYKRTSWGEVCTIVGLFLMVMGIIGGVLSFFAVESRVENKAIFLASGISTAIAGVVIYGLGEIINLLTLLVNQNNYIHKELFIKNKKEEESKK